MCIIVIQPEGHVFDDDAIVDFYEHNQDGFGFMWHEGKKVNGVKTVPRTAAQAVELYREHAAGVAGVLHYRYATSGPITAKMAHPFLVNDDLLVMHNGVFGGFGTPTESDTMEVVRTILKPEIGPNYRALYDPDLMEWLTMFCIGNVLVFMDREGSITRFGNKGVEFDGCWYSNTYAWTPPPDSPDLPF